MKNTTYSKLTKRQKELIVEAQRAMKNSYSPYSNFMVGAAVLTKDNKIISGTNFENSAYGETICAERVAITRANSMGYRDISAIAIIGKSRVYGSGRTKQVVSPCGSCRQVLFEASQISGQEIEVIMSDSEKEKIVIATISELLPLGFGPKNIGMR